MRVKGKGDRKAKLKQEAYKEQRSKGWRGQRQCDNGSRLKATFTKIRSLKPRLSNCSVREKHLRSLQSLKHTFLGSTFSTSVPFNKNFGNSAGELQEHSLR